MFADTTYADYYFEDLLANFFLILHYTAFEDPASNYLEKRNKYYYKMINS